MTGETLNQRELYAKTSDGWSLQLRRTRSKAHFVTSLPPVLIVPGYGMNSFIFGYHPRGTSMSRCLAEAGFEVWSANLRGQGDSTHVRPDEAATPSLETYATLDVPAIIEKIKRATSAEDPKLIMIGCSLGGTIGMANLALMRTNDVRAFVAMGAPLRWLDAHPLIKTAFASPAMAGRVRMTKTQQLVRNLIPYAKKVPRLLSIYIQPGSVDMDRIDTMANTVEDPDPNINRQIAVWLNQRDLKLGGQNLTEAVGAIDLPLLVIAARHDGIVPEKTAYSVMDAWGGDDIESLTVGDAQTPYAHANLFVANDAPRLVFAPLIDWMIRKSAG